VRRPANSVQEGESLREALDRSRTRMVKTPSQLELDDTNRPDFTSNLDLPRHGWYRFKEGFSATLVKAFVDEHMPSRRRGRLLDPFLGSGTTAVEGARLGHDVHGMEVNPFMAFLADVKTRDYSEVKNIEGIAAQCLKSTVRDGKFSLPSDTTLVERKSLKKWLFNKEVAQRFEQLRTSIHRVRSVAARDLLILALVSSVESVANARKDGKCWRYKANWRLSRFDAKDLDVAFAGSVMRYGNDILLSPKLIGCATVTRGDAREMSARLRPGILFDGVLTSPPYLNSFDYTDIYRPELLLLKEVKNSEELRNLRFGTLRSHVQVAWTASAPLQIPALRKKILAIHGSNLWCGRIPEMINAYFVDLNRVIGHCASRLSLGAKAGFVVADSAYCGEVIPVASILAEILERNGFFA